ncbi:hypothetical protein CUMW_282800 [Citrus unshiu]|uniref:Uncharacterized protein n=1 Tax=Citrus unshiu TaxID=55188 RepID=A0A2H5N3R0_CITUN|nr:hypothetical protein CUMW_282800 [Citrus unshiu]
MILKEMSAEIKIHIFSIAMLGSFEHLQHLKIRLAARVQEMSISKEGGQMMQLCESSEEDKPDIPSTTAHLFLPEKAIKELSMHDVIRDCCRYQLHAGGATCIFHVFPNLEELGLDGKDIRMIWHGDFPQHLFGGLKVLQLGFDASPAGFPLGLLERFHNLEKLRLDRCSYKEILSNDGHLDQHVGKLAQIKYLRL